MIIIGIDLETTANGPDGSPEAQWEENKVLLYGHCSYSTFGWTQIYAEETKTKLEKTIKGYVEDGEEIVIVAHNLKFDLKYLVREMPDLPWHRFHYHCTMFEEYLRSGHTWKFPSLVDAAIDRGLTPSKSLNLKQWLSTGKKMEDIPFEDLRNYVIGDVQDLIGLFDAQLPPRCSSHDHALPLAMMELNGLPLDVGKTKKKLFKANKELFDVTNAIEQVAHRKLDIPKEATLNYTAPRTLSYLLTGYPTQGIQIKKHTIKFKHGEHPILTAAIIHDIWGKVTPNHLGYPMNSKTLGKLKAKPVLVQAVERYRELDKLKNTYYVPLLAKIEGRKNKTIHPKLNMCLTRTGRLSSSDPNGQNMPEVVKDCFKNTEGAIYSIDFSQLEIVAAANIFGDPTLLKDLIAGEDIHFNSGRSVFNWKDPSDMTKESRKLVKNVNFGLLYGGTAAGLSYQTGQPKKIIQDLMDAFYARYPKVAEGQEKFYEAVVENMEVDSIVDGEQRYKSHLVLPNSGRRFGFIEAKAPEWFKKKTGSSFCFKPTEVKNYPIQGFAGGDIVPYALTEFNKALIECGAQFKLRMTIHDDIVVDAPKESYNTIEGCMTTACLKTKEKFNIKCPLNFEISMTEYWK